MSEGMGASEGGRARDVATAIGLVGDPAFAALRARAKAAPLSRAEFDLLPVPEGCPRDAVWELLGLLRRQTSVVVPYLDSRGRQGWYSITNSVMEDCAQIDRLCGTGSRLAEAVSTHDPASLFLEQLVGEARAVLEADGLALGYEEARAVVLGESRPETPAQQVLANAVDVIYETPALAGREADERLLVDIRRRLSQRLREPAPEGRPAGVDDAGPWAGTSLAPGDALRAAADIARGRGVDPAEHMLLRCLGIDGIIAPSRPFAGLNSTTSWLFGRVLMVQAGLPALAFAPVRLLQSMWAHGLTAPGSSGASRSESIALIGGTVDFTGNIAGTVELVRDEAARMDEAAARATEQELSFDAELGEELGLNRRQRDVALRAVRDPASVFTIAAHARAQRVAYATARADLLGLEKAGLLNCEKNGRAFAFRPRPGLRAALGQGGRRG